MLPLFLQIVGPVAQNPTQMFGDYTANLNKKITRTPMEGLSTIAEKVIYKAGCNDTKCPDYDKSSVMTTAQNSDVIVVCLGTGRESNVIEMISASMARL